ncbi:putative Zn-dependent protease with MMP-like domain [Kitasatospora acidiphila]
MHPAALSEESASTTVRTAMVRKPAARSGRPPPRTTRPCRTTDATDSRRPAGPPPEPNRLPGRIWNRAPAFEAPVTVTRTQFAFAFVGTTAAASLAAPPWPRNRRPFRCPTPEPPRGHGDTGDHAHAPARAPTPCGSDAAPVPTARNPHRPRGRPPPGAARVTRTTRARRPSVADDLALPHPPVDNGRVEMSREEFEGLVSDALDQIPPQLAAMMDNVAVFVEDEPDPATPELLGLYEGTPLTERGEWYAGVLPDRIIIYRGPALRLCETAELVIAEVRTTVIHEVAHHFGFDDHELHELGWS